jgi:glutathione S-transferase
MRAFASRFIVTLFPRREYGNSITHTRIAQRHAGCLPDDANARARAIAWMFAAVNTVEPPILEFGTTTRILESDKPWYAERLPLVMRTRLYELSSHLGTADWLDGAFSAGGLMMVRVLQRSKSSGSLEDFPNLVAYLARGETRPAYKRAFAAQLAVKPVSPPPIDGIRECVPARVRSIPVCVRSPPVLWQHINNWGCRVDLL